MLYPATIFLLALSATTVIATPASSRDSTAAIIGTFNGGTCSSNQQDWSDSVAGDHGPGSCHELPGSSMKIWWVKKGCLVLMFPNERNCRGEPTTASTEGECVDTRRYLSWTAYCH